MTTAIIARHGVVLIDKPAGVTSRAIDNQLKRALPRGASIGHAGTLDPFATGLLPVMIGEATKLSQWLTGGVKVYEAVLQLGVKTDTADCDGAVIEEAPIPAVSEEAVGAAMQALTGEIKQVPPKYSAIKQDGRPLYALAREGLHVDAPVRIVKVEGWRLDRLAVPEIAFTVTCGSGTYVRTLGEQLAELLGTVGHLRALRRVQAGDLRVEDAVSPAEALASWPLLPITRATRMPNTVVSPAVADALFQGRQVTEVLAHGGSVIATQEDGLPIAILERVKDGDAWRVVRGFRF